MHRPGDGDQSVISSPKLFEPILIMNFGKIFLSSFSTGFITPEEMNWVALNQKNFSRTEAAAALRLGRLLDQGKIEIN